MRTNGKYVQSELSKIDVGILNYDISGWYMIIVKLINWKYVINFLKIPLISAVLHW